MRSHAASTPDPPPKPAAELPDDLPGAPLLGSVPALRRDSLGFLREAERRGGALAPFRIGRERWVLASRAEAVEQVLLDRDGAFEKPDAIYGAGRLLFGNALTGLKGAAWRERRTVVAPAFHRQPIEAQAIVEATERWLAGHADGSPLRLDLELEPLMVEVACANMLGPDATDSGQLAAPVSSALAAMGTRVQLGVPLPDWLPVPPVLRMRRAVGEVNRFLERIIARRRSDGDMGGDLLGALAAPELGLSDRDVRDEIAVAAAVGGHQLSIALCWTLHLLALHPDEATCLRRELDALLAGRAPTLADLPELPFAAAVLEESMRLYPPFYLIGRAALRDAIVCGTRIPAGTTVILSPWVTQRLERYFVEPQAFRPQRWLDGLARRLPRGAYFPTGGGGRLCVAQSALRKHLLLTLASLLRGHDVVIDPRQPVKPRPTTSLELSPGLIGVLRPRILER
jgi:cytochrome P450